MLHGRLMKYHISWSRLMRGRETGTEARCRAKDEQSMFHYLVLWVRGGPVRMGKIEALGSPRSGLKRDASLT